MRARSGFTIVELLVVIVVVAILAGIATVSYSGVRTQTVEANVRSDLNMIGKQLEAYKVLNGRYPMVEHLSQNPVALELEDFLRKNNLYTSTRSKFDANLNRLPSEKSFIFCASPDRTQLTVVAWAPMVTGIPSTELEKAVGKKILYYSSLKSYGETTFKYDTGLQNTGLNLCNSAIENYDLSSPRRWSFDAPTQDAQ